MREKTWKTCRNRDEKELEALADWHSLDAFVEPARRQFGDAAFGRRSMSMADLGRTLERCLPIR